ncbi:MAG: hypothetical protein MUC59_10050, partial [Saprospiraceae bacterium]|nr:hypothetical protein [Saprospiraceae bacterium]
ASRRSASTSPLLRTSSSNSGVVAGAGMIENPDDTLRCSEVGRDPVERTISTVYYALVNINSHSNHLIKQFSAKWFNVSDAPKLIFDHDQMVQHALMRLRLRTTTEPIGFDLLPEKFTMRQLQKLYEAIWDTKLDKRNFINKINSLDILDKLDEKDMTTSRKGSFLYRFDAGKSKNLDEKTFLLKFQ